LLLVLFLAAKPRGRAPYRWLVERIEAVASAGDVAPGGLVRYFRSAIETAQERGLVEVVRTGRQTVDVALRKQAARRLIWVAMTAAMFSSLRSTYTVRQVADITGSSERAVWRWMSGEYAPKDEALARLLLHMTRGDPGLVRVQRDQVLIGIRLDVPSKAGDALAALIYGPAVLFPILANGIGPQLTEGERRRMCRWLVELQSVSDGLARAMGRALAREGGRP
jgi:hypothetical protein